MKNHYEVLGLPQFASVDEVKAAYKKLAKEHHPDVNAAPEAEQRMKEINEANDVLSDPHKKEQYDNRLKFGNAPNFANIFGGMPNPFGFGFDFGGGFNRSNVNQVFEFETTIRVPYTDMILGCEREVRFGHYQAPIKFPIPPFMQNGGRITINDGNKYFHLKVITEMPRSLTEEQLELIRKLANRKE